MQNSRLTRLLAGGLLCLAFALPATGALAIQPADTHQHEYVQLASKTKYVYVTRTGSKYHRNGCRYLRQSKRRVTLKYAKSHGYSACKICKPPRK